MITHIDHTRVKSYNCFIRF